MSTGSFPYPAPWVRGRAGRVRARTRARASWLLRRPELVALLGVTAFLNLWNLQINGWANTYYSAAVRAMASSWHDFLFASLDRTGLMTVDKPPLALWVQALSVRLFGFHPLSILVPEAVMGIIAVWLLYDLVQRRFGRAAGAIAGFVLATTPMTVAVARHNNPDELLVLCSVAAVWAALRGLEASRTRWLVLSGALVGLGFETKMGVALLVVPGIAAAWLWASPARLRALRQLLAGGVAMAAVGGAWPLLVTLTPAADRPWISGTSDNSIWSLILGYNGLGRVTGQSGGPGGNGGFGGTMFGGATGPLRLLQSGLGDQAGWLLAFALVAGAALLVASRLRRRDPATGWLIAVGGAFLSCAAVFSFSSGIFHPYYVSFLAPFTAALVGAGVGLMLPRSLGGVGSARAIRVAGPIAIAGGAVGELVVLGGLGGALAWAVPVVVAVCSGAVAMMMLKLAPRVRVAVVGVALAALLAAPATWAAETLGHATSSTFPAGGAASASAAGPPGSGGRGLAARPPAGAFGAPGGGPPPISASGGSAGGRAAPAGPGFGGSSSTLTAAVRYAEAHGGGTIGVASQSSAAEVILSSDGNVAGLGGFSGRESSVTASWLAMEVRAGRLRWLLVDSTQQPRLPGDTRAGSQDAFSSAERVARKVTFTTANGTRVTMYDLRGRASAILKAAGQAQ